MDLQTGSWGRLVGFDLSQSNVSWPTVGCAATSGVGAAAGDEMPPRTECAGSGELLPPRGVILRGGGEGDCLSFGHPVSSDACLFLGDCIS
jgi:hypothetical protein